MNAIIDNATLLLCIYLKSFISTQNSLVAINGNYEIHPVLISSIHYFVKNEHGYTMNTFICMKSTCVQPNE